MNDNQKAVIVAAGILCMTVYLAQLSAYHEFLAYFTILEFAIAFFVGFTAPKPGTESLLTKIEIFLGLKSKTGA